MERSIGCKMAELEPIKGYNCTKTAKSQKRLLRKKIKNPALFLTSIEGLLTASEEFVQKH